MPLTTPAPAAQLTASAYHAPAGTSVKPASAAPAGLPAMRLSTVASMARVMGDWGLNTVSLTPWNSSCS